MADDGDVVLIVGKGHEKYNMYKSGYHPFDERKIIDRALKERSKGQNHPHENNA